MTAIHRGALDIDVLAERLLRHYDGHTPGVGFAEGLRLSLDQAQQLQDAVARLREARGENMIGYKIGCVDPGNQRRNGVSHPVRGRLWSSERHATAARLSRANFANLAIEGEFAVTLSRDIGPGDHIPERLVDCVDRVAPVIELHNLVFRGSDPKGPELIANNAIHAGFVSGDGRSAPTASVSTDLRIFFDGEQVDSWDNIRWPDDILKAVDWLADDLAQSGLSLQRGQTILTGAFGPPLPVAAVGHVEVTSSQFGAVTARIE